MSDDEHSESELATISEEQRIHRVKLGKDPIMVPGHIINYLLTSALPYWLAIARSIRQGLGLRLSREDLALG